MKINAAIPASLEILTAALDRPGSGRGADISDSLHQLTVLAAAAVPTYLGLSVVVAHSTPPLTVTSLATGATARDIRTSLHLSLPGPGDARKSLAVAIILYARSPGTFVDLAADVAWLTGRPPGDFVLDQHLTLPAGSPADERLHAASAINQAIGALIGRGYTPQEASWQLDVQASHHRTDRHAAARLILSKIRSGDDEHFDMH